MAETVIILIFPIVAGLIVAIFYFLGKNALKMFPDISTVEVVFREKYASGYSNKSIITKAGGAAGVLEVVVTKEELWLKTGIFFGVLASMYGVLHKISRKNLVKVSKVDKRRIIVHFKDENNIEKSLTIKLSGAEDFMNALRKKKS